MSEHTSLQYWADQCMEIWHLRDSRKNGINNLIKIQPDDGVAVGNNFKSKENFC